MSLVRHLFQILYEGAGNDKPRFLKANGGFLEPEECDVIWILKPLRIHDPEHSKEGDIRKSYIILGEALQKLGLSGIPVTENEFLALQKSLLSQVKDFLTNLAIEMRKQPLAQ